MRTVPLWSLIVATALASACVPQLPTVPTGEKPRAGSAKPAEIDDEAAKPSLTAYTGQVLGLDGQPAAGVSIKSYIIATGGGNIISTGGGNIIATGGGNIISTGGGNIIATGGGNYRVLGASEVETDDEGHFTLDMPATAAVNIEAIQEDDVKAIQLEVKKEQGPIKLQLAKTGSITGKVTAPDATSVSDFTGVDVFIPGTGYLAKTAADGSFTIPNVPVGTFALFAMKTGLGTALVQGVEVESDKATSAPSLALSVKTPLITGLSQEVAGPEVELTITGEHFGATEGKTLQVTVGGTKVTSPNRVDDKTIKVKIPTSAGSGEIVVEVDGIASAGKPFKVLKSLELAHNHAQLVNGKTYTFTAKGKDTADVAVDGPPVTWEVVEGTALEVDAAGQVTAKALGTAKLKATSGSVSSAPFTVEVAPYVYEVTTLAGSGTAGNRDGQGTAADFSYPLHMVEDSQGNLVVYEWIEDINQFRIRKVTPAGAVSTWIAATDQLPASSNGMAIDSADNLYLTNATALVSNAGHHIVKIGADKSIATYSGGASNGAYDGALEPDGAATPATYDSPFAMAVDAQDVVYVSENPLEQDARIRKLSSPDVTTFSQDIPWTAAAPKTPHIVEMTFDSAGNLYWAAQQGFSNHVIYKLTPAKAPTILAGGGPGPAIDGTGTSARFGYISGLTVDAEGNVLVCEYLSGDPARHQIRKVTPAGVVTTLAGGPLGFRDGRGKTAQFHSPQSLVVTSSGVIYLLDSQNRRIRKLVRVTQ